MIAVSWVVQCHTGMADERDGEALARLPRAAEDVLPGLRVLQERAAWTFDV